MDELRAGGVRMSAFERFPPRLHDDLVLIEKIAGIRNRDDRVIDSVHDVEGVVAEATGLWLLYCIPDGPKTLQPEPLFTPKPLITSVNVVLAA